MHQGRPAESAFRHYIADDSILDKIPRSLALPRLDCGDTSEWFVGAQSGNPILGSTSIPIASSEDQLRSADRGRVGL